MTVFRFFATILLLCSCCCLPAQLGWTWTELPSSPESVSNNAVTQAYCGDTLCVYSFCGIDSTLSPAGIHLHAWRYNTISQLWTALPDVPDVQGKIAAGASTVDNLIYLIGGYHVNPNLSEVSSEKVHIFDPDSNLWLADGAPLPIATDDHVQTVYQDSLIYVITGWSNTTNITAVQIYDPSANTWQAGSSLPNLNTFKSFGASGAIVGDSIFYMGGVSSSSFAATSYFRKGAIDPSDPTEIAWELLDDYVGSAGYRMASATWNDRVFWVGGSSVAYNFDGVAYNGSGGVEPEFRISTYFSDAAIWDEGTGAPFGVMDLRGIATVTPTSWIICGGMSSNQLVSNKMFLLQLDTSASVEGESEPRPNWQFAENQLVIDANETGTVSLWNTAGLLVVQGQQNFLTMPLGLATGVYCFNWQGTHSAVSGSFFFSAPLR